MQVCNISVICIIGVIVSITLFYLYWKLFHSEVFSLKNQTQTQSAIFFSNELNYLIKLNNFEVILIKFSVCLCKKVWSHRTNKFWGVITGIFLVNKLLQYNTKFRLPYPHFHSHKRRAMGCTPNSFFRWHLFLRTKSFELFQRPLVQQRSKLCSMSNHREYDSL